MTNTLAPAMRSKEPYFFLLLNLFQHVSKKRRYQLIGYFILLLTSSLTEIVSIGSIVPFLSILTSPESIQKLPFYNILAFVSVNQDHSYDFIILSLLFGLAAIISGVTKMLLAYVTSNLSFAIGSELSIDTYKKSLYQSYSYHISQNSSNLIDGIVNKSNQASGCIFMVLNFISSTFMSLSILGILFFASPLITLQFFLGIGSFYVVTIILTRSEVKFNSKLIARESVILIKLIQEALGGIRDVIVNNSRENFISIYELTDLKLRKARANNYFISFFPRHAIEALSILFVSIALCFYADKSNNILNIIPIFGLLALGSQRLLPSLQQIYTSYVNLQASRSSLEESLRLIENIPTLFSNKVNYKPLKFNKKIELRNVFFGYKDNLSPVLKNVNLVIPKGSCVGFIGKTGSGKSTLLDIVMGLLIPNNGMLLIDSKVINEENSANWQANLSHVPQNVFVADLTIFENIAFGVKLDAIDKKRVIWAARKAKIHDEISVMEFGYYSLVGERGVKLSGGQRQRLGIARSLYLKKNVIILDEATSSLDMETENEVIDSLLSNKGKNTILIVAHRISTLKKCDFIVEIKNNKLNNFLSYSQVSSKYKSKKF